MRRSLGDDVLFTRGDNKVGLNPALISVDVTAFEIALGEGRAVDAMTLYRGDFLADFNVDDALEFERWAADRRREFRRLAVDALWHLAYSAVANGERDGAIAWAWKAVELAENTEGDARRAMQIISDAGERIRALSIFETVRQRLATDLDAVPQTATLVLANSLRTNGCDVRPNLSLYAPMHAVLGGLSNSLGALRGYACDG